MAYVAGIIGLSAVAGQQQVPFDEALRTLRNPDKSTRLSALKLLRDANYPEAAVPVAQLVTDVEDDVQVEAINAELGFFLAKKIESRTRVGLIVEVRGRNTPQRAFAAGPDVLAPRVVPPEVPLALSNALKDRASEVRLAAIYAFGVLAPASPDFRPSTLLEAASTIAVMIRQDQAAIREGGALVAGRVWKDCGASAGSTAGCSTVGDALIDGMNDRDEYIQIAAMDSLGQLRYAPAVPSLTDRFRYYQRGRAAEIALNAVSRTGSPASAPLFRQLLRDGREGARILGIEGLARAGEKAALPEIQAAAGRKRSDELELAVAFAEQKLGAAPRLEAIVRGLTRDRTRALAREYVTDLARADSAGLLAFLQDPDPDVRGEIAALLGQLGDAAVIPRVEPLVRDPDPAVAQKAAVAVARLKSAGR